MIADFIIYVYVVVCILLLSYSYIYIYKSRFTQKKINKMEVKWRVLLNEEFENLKNSQPVSQKHLEYLRKKLVSINNFISYINAMNYFKEQELLLVYLKEIASSQQYLAYKYLKRSDMERSFFAHAISLYPPNVGNDYPPILEILIRYMDNSSISCRENVLRALYAIGNVYAIENALQFINNRNLYHHSKLLADGLTTFRGNKDELMKCLWKHMDDWNNSLMVSVVNFISLNSSEYTSIFLPYLTNEKVYLELRIEMLRYYRKYYYEPVREILYSFLNSNVNINLSIVSAAVLASYPSQKAVEVLKNALYHSNWYVRYNAAESLLKMNISKDEVKDILHGNDQYAKEILTYMMEQEAILA